MNAAQPTLPMLTNFPRDVDDLDPLQQATPIGLERGTVPAELLVESACSISSGETL